ncbi:outer membrane protein assembly factor BamD [Nibribacter ruber]|uniref:Outer membrane protein assembly factor BamD n=1 Tax=Nibribacter ruber TaxID=2698458 RepID=A0A6P1P140_9BACT|nr:outer membrane protein assembly factor BamD [Nibribacter ruber]QHL87213.1 outer membrane protein assembly factor BamD [Nibribacter ruber]
MTKRLFPFLTILLAAVLLSSCSNFQKLLKSDDVDKRYAGALKYYEEGEYEKAGVLLGELLPLLKGRSEYEKANFLFAYTKYYQHLYLESSFHFIQFSNTFPRSQYVEEAAFMNVRSLANESPNEDLDQSNTSKALVAIQDFLRRYPNSQFKEEANKLYADLSTKVELKAYDNAKLYYKLTKYNPEYYKAAVIALANFRRDYPSSKYSEEAAALRIDAQHSYAKESIESKQKERYQEVVAFYQNFVDTYPNSKFLRTAEGFYDDARKELERLNAAEAATAAATTSNQ